MMNQYMYILSGAIGRVGGGAVSDLTLKFFPKATYIVISNVLFLLAYMQLAFFGFPEAGGAGGGGGLTVVALGDSSFRRKGKRTGLGVLEETTGTPDSKISFLDNDNDTL